MPPEVKALPKKKRRKKKRLSRKPLSEAVVSSVTMAVTAITKQSGFRYIVPVDDNKLCYILSNHRGHLKRNNVLTIVLQSMGFDGLGVVGLETLVEGTHTMATISCAWIPIVGIK